ncbi:uncharacterized protein [Musca autumnalis]|uniref:uncharacterized protein n=1 Tax=Musca autumnalis TaxID=221902 RepID=UPI003CF10ACD
MSYYILVNCLNILTIVVSTQAAYYGFAFENDEMFERCPDVPDSFYVAEVVDNTNIEMNYSEGFVSVSGNHTLKWEGVQPTDRIDANGEVYQFRRGTWQPTPFSVRIRDFCKVQFDPTSYWYQLWSKHIPVNERKCVNNYGHTYSYEPFTVDARLELFTNMEGRYKIVGRAFAYDEKNEKRKNTICFQVIGEFYKIK